MSNYILLIIMTLLGAFGSFFLKKASAELKIEVLIKNPNLYLGGILYFSSAVINIYILKFLEYSIVLPLTSITYIWTMMIARKFLGESITAKKIMGVIVIIIGAIMVAV